MERITTVSQMSVRTPLVRTELLIADAIQLGGVPLSVSARRFLTEGSSSCEYLAEGMEAMTLEQIRMKRQISDLEQLVAKLFDDNLGMTSN
jgi:hypothetical protein